MTTIAFIGLGHMGNPMARRLLAHDHEVSVYDISPQAVAALAEEGAIGASSIASAVKDADVIITMLQTGDQVSHVCLGEEGIFQHAKKGALCIDSSSIAVEVSRQLHHQAASLGFPMLDAPVSGGVLGAEAGILTIMVGGSEADFQLGLPILSQLGKKVIYAGPNGNGQAAKICNNMILGISMIAVSEAFALAEKLGLEAKTLFDISSNASGQCWSMTSYCPVPGLVPTAPSNRHYEPGFTAQMMLKDLRLSQEAASTTHAKTPLGKAATALYADYVARGDAQKDFSGIIQMLTEE
jgi:3-hydroxyisobutyrate dehydrogenase